MCTETGNRGGEKLCGEKLMRVQNRRVLDRLPVSYIVLCAGVILCVGPRLWSPWRACVLNRLCRTERV